MKCNIPFLKGQEHAFKNESGKLQKIEHKREWEREWME